MSGGARPLVILLDEGAPVPTAEPFLARLHGVIYHHEVLESGATDERVASMAILNKATLIAVDGDMRRIVRRFGAPGGGRERYSGLNLISVRCNEVLAAKRLDKAMSFIEHEWRFACEKASRRMWVDVEAHKLITYR